MRYTAFIFDIDGTLIDTEKTGVLSLIETVRTLMGREMPYEEAYPYFGVPSSKVGGILGYHDSKEFNEVWEENFMALVDMMKPFEGVVEVLAAVKDAGRGIGCVTSRSRYEFNKDEQLAKLLPYISQSVCAEDCAAHKPEPEPLLKCISMLERACGRIISPSDCIYIGDTVNDCLCAHAAGCAFALADWQGRGLQGMEPEHHLTSVGDIQKLIDL